METTQVTKLLQVSQLFRPLERFSSSLLITLLNGLPNRPLILISRPLINSLLGSLIGSLKKSLRLRIQISSISISKDVLALA